MLRFNALGRRVAAPRAAATFVSRFSTDAPLVRAQIKRLPTLTEVQFKGTRPVDLHIRASHAENIELAAAVPDAFHVVTHPTEKSLRIMDSVGGETPSPQAKDSDPVRVELHLPSQLNLVVSLTDGHVTIHDKLEADVTVGVGRGNITVDKLRGPFLRLTTNHGTITVTSLVESDYVKLVAHQIDCKRLMAKRADITLSKDTDARDSSFGAMYTSLATLLSASTGTLAVGNVHGALDIRSDRHGAIRVGGVNGALVVEDTGDACKLDVHFDAIQEMDGTASRLVCGGDAHVSVAPSIPVHVDLHATAVDTTDVGFESGFERDQLEEDYVVATGTVVSKATETPVSLGGAGKINLEGAKASAMTTSFFSQDDDSDGAASPPSIFVHAVSGKITFKQLSWMDKIKQTHRVKGP
ncbi:Aste57867_24524 [Aphanomyces stellatus]|uniref:Aste57867_24524 protein n=1 Tax=Aphanomyces stellatus TaxID=120398 RepID=A0A485LS88_9STRA|nr:hypothetical protein As57867_024447 [Aphanomyces stellatus]VFU01163.1 Aste57867_24524 [Aphanomyces stellatus]